MVWYHSVTRLFIGNPVHHAGGRYIPYTGRHEAIGLHLFYQLGLQMQQYTGEGAAALHEYGCQVTDMASRTWRRARDDKRLGYEANYLLPEQYHPGPVVEPERDRRGRRAQRERGVPRGCGGQWGRGPQQRGVEPPVEDFGVDHPGDHPEPDNAPHDMPSFSLQLTPGTSQVYSSAPLLIAGTTIMRQEWDKYFPGPPEPSRIVDDRPTRDMHSGRRLSYGSSSRDAEDLSQTSSSPVTEATLCDTDMAEMDDYIEEPAETMVTAGPSLPALSTIMLKLILR
ncbi:uncharacterized protein [Nicotiana tomentosiformis]|uniref:uncharacterized protein isoform X1 n=2 Tax=Nicotiana tomentosiformis TaxID=4098 RepID=UPI00051C1B36|nr:uncharacterized protein LOC104110003 isoform X2 [Nicotiana tomentosiformis]